jgi:hypothetical protein
MAPLPQMALLLVSGCLDRMAGWQTCLLAPQQARLVLRLSGVIAGLMLLPQHDHMMQSMS